ncbi:rhomboid family intramembrane serine protease [Desulfurococcus mucosus]|uniref:Rhomboid family protein n=1 Tax=Desulfurococcus mucosus (strain ATCC 35584 / DSM 2162 / JCM 9187 / O7/1) TaxID=765177 RepID=E8R8Y4_DESM0|nr:rhomboid family intramembrane serine protease [Desulfurococcus mucosus]ADV64960.1 Rhomboid family protein [Desulfurococcus mucosus DSM 2162]
MVVVPWERSRGMGSSKATTLIVAANIVVYLYTSYRNMFLESTNESIYALGFIPALLFTDPLQGVVRIFTAMFTHADFFHIFFNMYFLWLFGRRIESVIGSRRYLLLYFASGLAAVLFHVAIIPVGGYDSLVVPAVGASGAISGVLGAYLLLFPYARLMWCMFFLFLPYCFPVSTAVFLIIWFAEQVLYGYMRLGGVAYFAHVGGFVAGLALTYVLTRGLVEHYRLNYTYDYIARWLQEIGIVVRKPRGLGGVAKAVLTVLLVLVAAGFAYSVYYTVASPPSTYLLSVTANNASDTVSLVVYRGSVEVSFSSMDYVRILLNRIQTFLYNPSAAGESVEYTHPIFVYVEGLPVPVNPQVSAVYDEAGVIKRGSGVIETRIVIANIYGGARIGGSIKIAFELSTTRIDTAPVLSIAGVMALSITAYSLLSLRRADEIAVVGEEYVETSFL